MAKRESPDARRKVNRETTWVGKYVCILLLISFCDSCGGGSQPGTSASGPGFTSAIAFDSHSFRVPSPAAQLAFIRK